MSLDSAFLARLVVFMFFGSVNTMLVWQVFKPRFDDESERRWFGLVCAFIGFVMGWLATSLLFDPAGSLSQWFGYSLPTGLVITVIAITGILAPAAACFSFFTARFGLLERWHAWRMANLEAELAVAFGHRAVAPLNVPRGDAPARPAPARNQPRAENIRKETGGLSKEGSEQIARIARTHSGPEEAVAVERMSSDGSLVFLSSKRRQDPKSE